MSEPDAVLIRPYRVDDRKAVIACVRALQTYEAQYEPRMKPPEDIGDWYVDGQLEECRQKKRGDPGGRGWRGAHCRLCHRLCRG